MLLAGWGMVGLLAMYGNGAAPAPTRGLVAWVELETPVAAPTRGLVSWAELETPLAPTRGRVSWLALEIPALSPTKGFLSWAELQIPGSGGDDHDHCAMTGLSGMPPVSIDGDR